MEVGKKLKELRFESGLIQKEVAENIGISRQRYSHYETGIRNVDLIMLTKLASFYGVSTDYLLGQSELRRGSL